MTDIRSKIESLLFVSGRAINLKELSRVLGEDKDKIGKALEELARDLKENKRGVRLVTEGDKAQLVSDPDNSSLIDDFLEKEEVNTLTRPGIETLTIIAYRSPISKAELEHIRGVNCSLILRNLSIKGLVEGKYDKRKKDTYYTVTLDFLRFLGVERKEDLPDHKKLSRDDIFDRILSE